MAKAYRILPELTEQDKTRFWSKVSKEPGQGPNGDCWEWQAGCDGFGHGKFGLTRHGFGSSCFGAHRIAFYLFYGVDPRPLCVLHDCDNPRCCNPSHLHVGTDRDNATERNQRNRHASGVRHWTKQHPESIPSGEAYHTQRAQAAARREQAPSRKLDRIAKLTPTQVKHIREIYDAGGVIMETLASQFSVSSTTILRIVHRLSWRHIRD